MFVLDASAILALINREAGADIVRKDIRTSEASIVNVAEVLTKLVELGIDPDEAMALVAHLGFRVRAFRDAHAIAVARLRPLTSHLGLSLGDRACLVQGQFSRLPVLTSDRRMADARIGVEIRLIR